MLKQIEKELGQVLSITNRKIPDFAKKSIEIIKTYSPAPEDLILLTLYTKLGQMLSYNRVSFASDSKALAINGNVYVSIYSMAFLGSGGGKDITVSTIDKQLLSFFKEYHKKNILEYTKSKTEQIQNEAESKFKASKAKKEDYIENHKPRKFTTTISDATFEGLYATMEAMQNAGFGSIFVKINELSLYIKGITQAQQGFFKGLVQAYDAELDPKITKGEKESLPIEGVPTSTLMYSSIEGLNEGKGRDELLNFMKIGFNRRCFININFKNENNENEGKSIYDLFNEAQAGKENLDFLIKEISKQFEKGFIQTIKEKLDDFYGENKNVFYLKDIKVIEKAFFYKNYCSILAKKENELFEPEKNGRYWKALHLATLIAAIEHPEDKQIRLSDLEYGIWTSEYFGKQAEDFLKLKVDGNIEKVFKFIKNGPKTKTEIRELGILRNDLFKQEFEKLLIELKDYCDEQGLTLIEDKQQHNKTVYSIKQKEHPYEAELQEIDNFLKGQ